jgi:hypothetical protein
MPFGPISLLVPRFPALLDFPSDLILSVGHPALLDFPSDLILSVGHPALLDFPSDLILSVGHKSEVCRACPGEAFRRPSSAVACYGGWKDGILNQNPIFELDSKKTRIIQGQRLPLVSIFFNKSGRAKGFRGFF